ncbi:hypothetical protein [Modestobacter sp. Leaf380]|uniref:hypothetical protein n=1 Tax=Modestobacter sp. Leaf380 TaxID=1736356 RepID=UPI0006FA2445|nr:hypothetical protein [Modestobacter sp. Leaf380]KQS66567.1 hypothetical protein ASG41_08725 [Modestobacter sp. Leaf380]
MSLRLPVSSVVALLGPAPVRAAVCAALDEDSARCAGGHASLSVVRLEAHAQDTLAARLEAAEAVRAPVVLVSRFTDGLGASERRTALSGLRSLAGRGATVVVDDVDPVAVLAVADAVLRVGADGAVELERLPDADALQPLLS